MRSPYGFEPVENCRNCSLGSEGFFCHLSTETKKGFEAIKQTLTYPKGAVLFVEGQPPRGVYVLCKGRLKLSMASNDGNTLILRFANPGEVVGLNATVSGQAYQLTAETLEPCQVNYVRREDFLRFLSEHADASIRAARQLSQSYQAACEQVRSLGLSHSAPEKLAKFLLGWSARGRETKEGVRARLALTHEEIGQTIGSSRETVTRTLGEFKNRGLVALHGSTLVIPNKAALENFVTT